MKLKKVLLVLGVIVGVTSMSAISYAEAKGGLRYTIAVTKFENKSGWGGGWSLGDAWAAVLTDELNQSGKFIVLGEKDMRQSAIAEQDFAASDRAAGGGKKVVTGQMTPAQLLIKGDITHFESGTSGGDGGIGFGGFNVGLKTAKSEINVVMYIVDSSTGQVVASKKCNGVVTDTGVSVGGHHDGFSGNVSSFSKTNEGKAIELAVKEGVTFLESKLAEIPWTAAVVMVKNKQVYINRGTREGVVVGKVFSVGENTEVRDPGTGELLDNTMEIKGTIKVTSVKEKMSICTIVDGDGFDKGMMVMPK